MKTLEERIRKVRKLLGKNYHLSESLSFENDELKIESWALYRQYRDINVSFSKDNLAVMTSKKNTIEELEEYAKKHKKYDLSIAMPYTTMILAWLMMIFCIINCFYKNELMTGFFYRAETILFIIEIVILLLNRRNFEVDYLELVEFMNRDVKVNIAIDGEKLDD